MADAKKWMRAAQEARADKGLDCIYLDRVGRRGLMPKADDVLYVRDGENREAIAPLESAEQVAWE